MTNRIIKFNAWLPALKVMLKDVNLNNDGMIWVSHDDFAEMIEAAGYEMDEDGLVFNKDRKNGEPPSLNAIPGDDFYWIEEKDHIKLQHIGISDRLINDIFEGDIVKYKKYLGGNFVEYVYRTFEVIHQGVSFAYEPIGEATMYTFNPVGMEVDVIGNIYENPELLKK